MELAGKKVHVEKRSLVGPQIEAFAAAVRQDDVHLLAIPVSPFAGLASNLCTVRRTASAVFHGELHVVMEHDCLQHDVV